MLLKFDETEAENYKSNSQKIRVMSECWIEENAYCVQCGTNLNSSKNNKPVGDFYCSFCKEEFELKSKSGKLNDTIVDGAYSTMIEKIEKNDIPNFFYLNYDCDYLVNNLIVIPKHFFTQEIIEKRKPLANSARRAGWIGCNINLKSVPQSGRLFLIKDKQIIEKQKVITDFNKMLFLRSQKLELKGWLLDVMSCIDKLNKTAFSLNEIYYFESLLKLKHPNNNNIKAKIRQQLQILRDNNYIEFKGRGIYRLK